jgi:hypothetical protein
MHVYRIQDSDGRGPYRPELGSQQWKDAGHDKRNPPFYVECGFECIDTRRPGEHMGCAFRTIEQAQRWFSADEYMRLRVLGYRFVRLAVDRIAAESPTQLVVARKRPFAEGATVLNLLHNTNSPTKSSG